MTERQEEHLRYLIKESVVLLDRKYRCGAAEHGDTLLDVSAGGVLNYAIDEAVDQLAYLLTLKEKLTCALVKS